MVGRAAVLASCLVGAGLGFAAGRLLGISVAATPTAATAATAGGLLPLALLAAVDRRRWRAALNGYGWGGTVAEVSAVVADLLRRGVVASVEMQDEDETASVRYRNADADVVAAVLVEHGVIEHGVVDLGGWV